MTPLPGALGGRELVAWRLDEIQYASTWDSGEGPFLYGGWWSSKGVRAVYCALDPSTAILEVAVHKGFRRLDTEAHVLTSLVIADPSGVHVVDLGSLPNPNWLVPGTAGAGQAEHGDALLAAHRFVVLPSVVSPRSWNLVFMPDRAAGAYAVRAQERLALDTRLHPAR